jgi:hypothetical protein
MKMKTRGMRKSLLKLSVAILIVVFIAAAYVRFREVPLKVQISDIIARPEKYNNKLVEVRGTLINTDSGGGLVMD